MKIFDEFKKSPDWKTKWQFIKEMEYYPLERVREWQLDRIKHLLKFSANNIPYYRSLFHKLGIEPNDINSLDDFSRMPTVTKEILRENFDRLRTDSIKGIENHTSGSTGEPLCFFQDDEYLQWAALSRRWGLSLCGYEGGEKHVFLWGSDPDAKNYLSLRNRLSDLLHNRMFVNSFDITGEQIKKYAHKMARWKPDFVFGYVSTLDLFADAVVREGLNLNCRGIQSTAGTLSPSLRHKLEAVLGGNVYDRYGSREVSIIGHECDRHCGLHECSFHNYVEKIDIGNGWSKIIVTNLHNKAFPFIRYDIGDICIDAPTECSCGRSFPLLRRIIGRTVEIVTSPSGKLIDGEFFSHLFYKIKGVRQFQIIQETGSKLLVKIVKGNDFDSTALSFLRGSIKEYGDPLFNVSFEFVQQIKPFDSGKRAFVISKVPIDLK